MLNLSVNETKEIDSNFTFIVCDKKTGEVQYYGSDVIKAAGILISHGTSSKVEIDFLK